MSQRHGLVLLILDLVALAGLALVLFYVRPVFEDMLKEFGKPAIGALTRAVLARWWPGLSLGVVAGLVVAGQASQRPGRRRGLLAGGLAAALAASALTLFALYWPIFSMAGNIQP